jgi:hypothetical protein
MDRQSSAIMISGIGRMGASRLQGRETRNLDLIAVVDQRKVWTIDLGPS